MSGRDGGRRKAGRAPGQIGWRCSYAGVGGFVLCLRCGDENRPPESPRGYARPLVIDDVRPHPQSCHRCRRPMAAGILPALPDRFPGRRGSRSALPDYVALRKRWKEELAWRESRGIRIGVSTSWPVPWEWGDSCHSLAPLPRDQVHLVRAVLGMTHEDGLRELEDAFYDLGGTDLAPWLTPVPDRRGHPDPVFSLAVHMGLDGMGSASMRWRALPFDESHVLVVAEMAGCCPLPFPLGLARVDEAVAGAALLARDHPIGVAVGATVGFESLDLFEIEELELRDAYRFALGVCGAVDEILLAEDPERAAARTGQFLPASLSLFASRLPGPDGRRRVSRMRGCSPRPEELGPVRELVGLWAIRYPDDEGIAGGPERGRLELRADGTYEWDRPPRWAGGEGRWGVVRRGRGIHGIFVETPAGGTIEHYLVVTRIGQEPPRMHWQLTRWGAVVFADRALVADRSEPRGSSPFC